MLVGDMHLIRVSYAGWSYNEGYAYENYHEVNEGASVSKSYNI